jgi:hypothetical protein
MGEIFYCHLSEGVVADFADESDLAAAKCGLDGLIQA